MVVWGVTLVTKGCEAEDILGSSNLDILPDLGDCL